MSGVNSAYAMLGLRPGASRAQVDEAYRRLIKLYHPDRTGGNGDRAAEINRAYSMLRRDMAAPPRPRRAVAVPPQPRRRPRRRRTGWLGAGAIAVVAAAAVVANDLPRGDSGPAGYAASRDWIPPQRASSVAAAPSADFEEPLQTLVIDRAIGDAVKFSEDADPAATLEFSRACHNRLRDEPSLTWFDACVAFDEATIILTNSNPLTDSGPLDAPSVVARQMAAARMLSADTFAADSRLHQIRSRVELMLIPKLDEAAAQRP